MLKSVRQQISAFKQNISYDFRVYIHFLGHFISERWTHVRGEGFQFLKKCQNEVIFWRKEFECTLFPKMKFPTFTFILKVFQNRGIFRKTSLTSNYEILKDKRQVDGLSFKRSLVDERKLGLELWSLMLTLTPMKDALVDYTHRENVF